MEDSRSPYQDKERIIQEYVPGKQAPWLHMIAHPGERCSGIPYVNAIGRPPPVRIAMIAGDIAVKAANVQTVSTASPGPW